MKKATKARMMLRLLNILLAIYTGFDDELVLVMAVRNVGAGQRTHFRVGHGEGCRSYAQECRLSAISSILSPRPNLHPGL